MKYDICNIGLAAEGKRRIEWAARDMPVLALIRKRFAREKPLRGLRMSCCLHVTTETANLVKTLKAGGADVVLCASNPLSTQDAAAASVVKHDHVPVFARNGEDRKTYYSHLKSALEHRPHVTMDDGADLVSQLHRSHPSRCKNVLASMEETTTGVIRLRAMAADGALKIPVIAVNDADTKRLFDNRYGTGQSTVDGILRATNILFAGRVVVVAGYGMCGRGFAMRAKGMGAQVVVCEVNPLRALEAAMDGYRVMPLKEAARTGDLFCTFTGDKSVLRAEHFRLMKDGAIIANSGHFNVEIDLPDLKKVARRVTRRIRPHVDAYELSSKRTIFLLADGRLINLAAAEGHPSCVMDMSFSVQALTSEWAVKNAAKFHPRVYNVPASIDELVAKLKMKSMGISIDKLTPEQKEYLSSWKMGT